MFEVIYTDKAPAPGNYSQGIKVDLGEFYKITTSGMAADYPICDNIEGIEGKKDIGVQTRRVLRNLRAVVEAGGGSLANITRININIMNVEENWERFNKAYEAFFLGQKILPTRCSFPVSKFPWEGVEIMMDATAYVPKGIL